MRSGTIDVPGIAGLGAAVKEVYEDFDEKMERLYELKAYFAKKLAGLENVKINGRTGHDSAPPVYFECQFYRGSE